MKNLTIGTLILGTCLFATVPNHLDFQGLAINNGGEKVVNTNIAIKFEIINSSNSIVFTDTNISVPTSSNAIFTLKIGDNSDFSNISWGDSIYSLKVYTDYNLSDGIDYTLLGTKEFSTVPYSIHSKTSDIAKTLDGIDTSKIVLQNSDGVIELNSGLKLSSNAGIGKVLVSDEKGTASWQTISQAQIVDNLTSVDNTKALSAKQGKELKTIIDNINSSDNQNISAFTLVDKTLNISIENGNNKSVDLSSLDTGLNKLNTTDDKTLYSNAWGSGTEANATQATAWGNHTTASGSRSTSFGDITTASGARSTAFGKGTVASGSESTAFGSYTTANQDNMTAIGKWNTTDTTDGVLFVIGNGDDADNKSDIFIVNGNNYGVSWGSGNARASGDGSTAWGLETEASGTASTAFGLYSIADGLGAMAWGNEGNASGDGSTAFGNGTTASGYIATTWGNHTTASGSRSTSFGDITTASGSQSTAMGRGTLASGDNSVATGYQTIADHDNMFVVGKYNTQNNVKDIGDYPALFVVGNGVDGSIRSDAFSVYDNGNAVLAGSLTENSDRSLKTDIKQLENVLEKVLKLKGVSYNWISEYRDQSKQIGVIAQNIQEQFPELVSEDNREFLTVNYSHLSPILIEAIKEQQEIIDKKDKQIQNILRALEKAGIVVED